MVCDGQACASAAAGAAIRSAQASAPSARCACRMVEWVMAFSLSLRRAACGPPDLSANSVGSLSGVRRAIIESHASFDHEIELQGLVDGDGGMLEAVACRLRVAAHRVEAVADHAGREAVALT